MDRPPSIELVDFDGHSSSAYAAGPSRRGGSSSRPRAGGLRWLSAWWGDGKKARNRKGASFGWESHQRQRGGRGRPETPIRTLDGSDGDENENEDIEKAELDKGKAHGRFYFQRRTGSQRGALGRLATDDEVMKFSHSIQFNAVPDWSNSYIAYSNLKKL